MAQLHFKIKRYNQGGYLGFLNKPLPKAEAGNLLSSDNWDEEAPSLINSSTEKMIGGVKEPAKFGMIPDSATKLPSASSKPSKNGLSAGWGAAAYGAGATIDAAVPQQVNKDFYQQNAAFRDSMNEHKKFQQFNSGLAKGASSLGPWGAVVGGVIEGGNAISKGTHDQYGIYKSKGAEVLDNGLDITKSWENVHDLFGKDGFTANNIGNLATMGLFGESASQKEAKKQKDIWQHQVLNGNIADARSRNAMAYGATPQYQAAAYGKKGLKLRSKTKFSRNANVIRSRQKA